MKHELLKKLIACYLLFLVLGLILFFWMVPGQVRSHLEDEKAKELMSLGQSLSETQAVINCSFSEQEAASLKELLDSVSDTSKAEIWLTNQEGRVIMSSRSAYPVTEKMTLPADSVLADDQPCRLTGNFFGLLPQSTLSIVVPVTQFPHTTDCVILHYPLALFDSSVLELSGSFFLFLLIAALLSLIPALGFYVLFYRPLKTTVKAATAYAGGNLNFPLPERENDEYTYLQNSLRYMAEDLNQSEEYQRTFLSNVSHDFRSPLTSIKGYAEAILDGTIQKEDQDRYLEIILSETERLNQLTKNILTVNRLGDSSILLELSVFDLHQVIRSIAASMEIQCREKDIHLVLSLHSGPQNVRADKEKIQQVIYNLLDNAIKFSHNHSSVTISTYWKKKSVFVSVRDSGIGIPADQLPRIWTRFYKSDSSRGKNKRGTGLGLSIVREIIQAHEQNINVISTEGVGSEFIFTLEKA